MSIQRDNFNEGIKRELAKRVGTLCSNPGCCTPTYGAGKDDRKGITKGVAAHITSAAKGGPRYDPKLTKEERGSINNGIWLCPSCADLIDKDDKKYSTDIIQRWKNVSEQRATKAIENPRIVNIGSDFSDTIILCTSQKNAKSLKTIKGEVRRNIKIKPIKAARKLIEPWVSLSMSNNVAEDEEMLSVACQNQGEGIDEFIQIKINFNGPAIKKVEIENENRVQVIDGGKKTASFVELFIQNLLPGEKQLIRVIFKKNNRFDVVAASKNNKILEVFIYEIEFGEDEYFPARFTKD